MENPGVIQKIYFVTDKYVCTGIVKEIWDYREDNGDRHTSWDHNENRNRYNDPIDNSEAKNSSDFDAFVNTLDHDDKAYVIETIFYI